MSAPKHDPVLAAWDRLRAAEKGHSRACDGLDEAEAKAKVAGLKALHPAVYIQGYQCLSLGEVRRRAKALPPDKAKEAIEAMRGALVAYEQQRRKAGLAPFAAAEKRAAMQGMADMRASTPFGVMLKLKLIVVEMKDGGSGFGASILASAISDLSRMARGARRGT
jgi:hypothetical protein